MQHNCVIRLTKRLPHSGDMDLCLFGNDRHDIRSALHIAVCVAATRPRTSSKTLGKYFGCRCECCLALAVCAALGAAAKLNAKMFWKRISGCEIDVAELNEANVFINLVFSHFNETFISAARARAGADRNVERKMRETFFVFSAFCAHFWVRRKVFVYHGTRAQNIRSLYCRRTHFAFAF